MSLLLMDGHGFRESHLERGNTGLVACLNWLSASNTEIIVLLFNRHSLPYSSLVHLCASIHALSHGCKYMH